MYKNIIFLDLYGVLITPKSQMRTVGFSTFDKEAVILLREIVEKFSIQLVLTSTIRLTVDWKERMYELFEEAGWKNPPIADRTPHGYGIRGDEIAEWLKENEVNKYVILDDHNDMHTEQQDRLVLCNSRYGLTRVEVKEVEKKFL